MNKQEKKIPVQDEGLERGNSLGLSIIIVIISYLAAQVAVFLGFAIPRGFFAGYGPAFLLSTLGFHALLLAVLFWFKADFYIEPTGERLARVNLANAITLFRVSTLPTILFLVIAAKDYGIRVPLLVLVILVFLSDFADGFVSRRGKQVTKIGRMLDSTSDYGLLIVLSVAFYYYFLIPAWFFAIAVARLCLQSVLVFILIAINRRVDPKTSPLGKLAVAALMVLYAAEILEVLIGPSARIPLLGLEGIVALILAASAVDKVLIFLRELGSALSGRRAADSSRQ
jgi:phosphatidylglycerophosphate synthase